MDKAVEQSEGQVIDINAKRDVEIIVHISEELDKGQRNDLVYALKGSRGITDAEFCPLRNHLILVSYDRGLYSSQQVLRDVISRNLSARLIGPI